MAAPTPWRHVPPIDMPSEGAADEDCLTSPSFEWYVGYDRDEALKLARPAYPPGQSLFCFVRRTESGT